MFSCPVAVELHAVVSVDNWTDTIADGRMDYITHIRSRNATLAKFDEAEKTLNQLAGKVGQLRNLTSGPHLMVLIALNNISLFDRTQRSKILDVAARVGFETPTFQKFGIRLSTFVVNATNLLIESTTQNPLLVNTGSKIR